MSPTRYRAIGGFERAAGVRDAGHGGGGAARVGRYSALRSAGGTVGAAIVASEHAIAIHPERRVRERARTSARTARRRLRAAAKAPPGRRSRPLGHTGPPVIAAAPRPCSLQRIHRCDTRDARSAGTMPNTIPVADHRRRGEGEHAPVEREVEADRRHRRVQLRDEQARRPARKHAARGWCRRRPTPRFPRAAGARAASATRPAPAARSARAGAPRRARAAGSRCSRRR